MDVLIINIINIFKGKGLVWYQNLHWTATVAQWVRGFVPHSEGWVFESSSYRPKNR